jgi:hypothetical protein
LLTLEDDMDGMAKGGGGTKLALVLGGTGKTGRRVVSRLKERGLRVRTGSRSGAPPFDWEAPSSWAPALDGVGAVYITYYPDLAVPGATDAIQAFCAQAMKTGRSQASLNVVMVRMSLRLPPRGAAHLRPEVEAGLALPFSTPKLA